MCLMISCCPLPKYYTCNKNTVHVHERKTLQQFLHDNFRPGLVWKTSTCPLARTLCAPWCNTLGKTFASATLDQGLSTINHNKQLMGFGIGKIQSEQALHPGHIYYRGS